MAKKDVSRNGRTRRSTKSILNRRNATSTTGRMNSVRDDALHVFESRHELLHHAIVDADCTVAWFETQPETFDLPGGRRYTPDALLAFRAATSFRPFLYREVKPAARLEADPDFDGRLADIVAACHARGAEFEVATEDFYRDPVRCRNASLIRHACRRAVDADMAVVRRFLEAGARSLVEIERETRLENAARFAALALSLDGIVRIASEGPIGLATVVRLI